MKIKTIAFILLVLPFFAFTTLHKYYVSVTQIDYIKEKKEVQITSRIFIDDFEKLLRERYDETITLGKEENASTNLYIEKYLKSKLIITINDTPQTLKFIGKEYEDDIMYCYFEIEKVRKINAFEVSNETLFDRFEEQKNIVRTFINSKHKTFVLIPENTKGMLKF
jgi:hypothetical protein